jgi:YD repeat-containing protein
MVKELLSLNLYKLQLLILFSLFSFCTYGQVKKNDFVPSSPEANALTKMTTYPVNLNTGIPEISIPLYQIESGSLKLPIQINYHSGGFKINEKSTSVGLGWSLSSDIQITRTINGLDDFKPLVGYLANSKIKTYYESYGECVDCGYTFSNSSPSYQSNAGVLAMGTEDGMPDRFNYKLLGKSGSFYFMKSNQGTGYSIVPVPFDNIQITYDNGKFTIIDTDGTVYGFGSSGAINVDNTAQQGIEISGQRVSAGPFSTNWVEPKVSTWKCREIRNSSGTEAISFSYQLKPLMTTASYADGIEYYNNEFPCSTFPPGISLINQYTSAGDANTTYEMLLGQYPFQGLSSPKYMVNSSGKSVFHLPYLRYSGSNNTGSYQIIDRPFNVAALNAPSVNAVLGLAVSEITYRGGKASFIGTDKLSAIVIQDLSGNEIRTIDFVSSYIAPNNLAYARSRNGDSFNGTLYLDQLNFKNNGQVIDKYAFVYNSKRCFGEHLKGSNAWGYSNVYTHEGSLGDPVIIPTTIIKQNYYRSTGSGCVDFEPNVPFVLGTSAYTELPDETGLRRGILQRIVYPGGGYTDFDFEPNLYQEIANDNAGPGVLIQMGGGLRIKSITDFDGIKARPDHQKYYRYGETENGIGLIMNNPPRKFIPGSAKYDGYNYKQNVYYLRNNSPGVCNSTGCMTVWAKETKTTYMPSSILDYSFPGSPIYYTKVTEYNKDMGPVSGKKVYTFYDPSAYENLLGTRLSVVEGSTIPYLYTDGLMGQPKSVADYEFKNSVFKLIHSKEFTYTKYKKPEQIRVVYAYLKNLYKVTSGNVDSQFDPYFGSSWASGSTFSPGSNYEYGQYGIASGKLLLSSETEKWITDDSTITGVSQYYYDHLPYLLPSRIVTANSLGEQVSKSIKYPYNFTGIAIYDHMKSSAVNMINYPVEIVLSNITKGQEISKQQINYGFVNSAPGQVVPISSQSSDGGGSLSTDVTYDQYDQYGNILQVTNKGSQVTSYLWGYNGKYLIAELKGVNYNTAIAGADINLLQNTYDNQLLSTALNTLRTNNSNALVTSFIYRPLFGMINRTNPNGFFKTYSYDNYGRLSQIIDMNGNIEKSFDYNQVDLNTQLLSNLNYVNVPMFGSASYSCSPNAEVTLFHQYLEGAYLSNIDRDAVQKNAQLTAENWSPSAYYDAQCVPQSQVSSIRLTNFALTSIPYPEDVHLELIQEESIVASRTFPITYAGVNQFYLRPGTYKASIRQSAISGGVIIKYLVSSSAGDSTALRTGDTITFQPGVTYTIQINNTL